MDSLKAREYDMVRIGNAVQRCGVYSNQINNGLETKYGKRPRDRQKRIDVVETNLEDLGVRNRRETMRDRDRWNDLAMKTLGK